jgi:hypothetical protein
MRDARCAMWSDNAPNAPLLHHSNAPLLSPCRL